MFVGHSRRKSLLSSGSHQEGSLAVESALILPVILAAVAATIVMSLRLSDNLFLNQGARELAVVLGRVPCLVALRGAGGSAPYTVSLSISADQSAASVVASGQLTALTNARNNNSCTTSNFGTLTSAARGMVGWYARQILVVKPMMVSDSLTLNVTFGPPAADVTATNGLCMVHLTITAQSRGWLSWATGSLVVSQSAPYVSNPVPLAGSACTPS